MTKAFDAAIVGGGLIGCALARELSRRGRRVVLLERDEPGRGASGASAGMLSPQADAPEAGPMRDLCLASRELYPEWARALERESGMAVGFRQWGIVRVAVSEAEGRRLAAAVRGQREAGLSAEEIDPRRAAELSGLPLSESVRRAFHFPADGAVDARRLTAAAARAAIRAGAEVRTGAAVRALRIESGRCRGVETAAGSVESGATILAAGAWSSSAVPLPFPLPVHPVKGQLMEALFPGQGLSAVLLGEGSYLVPLEDGGTLVGATAEDAGFDLRTTAGAAAGLLSAAIGLVPSMAEAALTGARAGLRPATPDGLPILGASPVDGFWLATGHYRNGILLAPATAIRVADAIEGRPIGDLAPFTVSRFDAVAPAVREGFG